MQSTARGIPGFPKHLLPFPADYAFVLPSEKSIDLAIAAMNTELSSLSWYWMWDQSRSAGVGFAPENVWSRQARRKLKLAGQNGAPVRLSAIPGEVQLGVRVQLKLVREQKSETHEVQVLISWTRGTDSVLFESFCGMLKRKMEA